MMLLDIQDLSVRYFRAGKTIPALRGVSLSVNEGETLGIVGESGCGKSTLGLSILRLIPPHEGELSGAALAFNGADLLKLDEEAMRQVRGRDIGIVFQDPFSSLNPVFRIGEQIAEAVAVHAPNLKRSELRARAMELLQMVRLPEPERMYESFPHQVSGGQRQRAMIACAIANRPKLLIADEPTTALDVTVQKEILDLLDTLQKELGMAILLITHHLGIVARYTERLAVLYAGQIAELGKTREVVSNPQHPYTRALLNAVPKREAVPGKRSRLETIPGAPPDLSLLPSGCIFHPRCKHAVDDPCKTQEPPLRPIAPDDRAACHLSPFPPPENRA